MTPDDILKLFSNLAVELDDLQFLIKTHPLLAHYTSLSVLEKILKTDELWFSNPLFMNDLEEVRFGILEGARLFLQGDAITQACGSNATRADTLKHAFNHYFEQFNKEQAFDTYVFCMSEHDPKNSDGRLSMWRGYGGQGTGAALVFNTAFVTAPNDNSPLIISRVHYASAEDRRTWLNQKLLAWCDILRNSAIPDNMLHVAAYWFFSLIKPFALKSKHHGFQEECEWRLIYLPDRDPQGLYKDKFKFDYIVGRQGVEPKLKCKIAPIDPSQTWTFFQIIERIILGPSLSSWLARRSIERMLETVGKPEFRQKVSASEIPLRPS